MNAAPAGALRARIENTIRFLAVDAVERAKSGHPGTPMALAGPAFEIWDQHLRFDPSDPHWPLRDRFVLSAGHASMLLYSLLHLYGFDLPLDQLMRFRQLGSRTPGHPEYGHTAGVEVTTGPLGQGFAHSVGMALAARMVRSRFSRDGQGPGHHFVYGIASDGDLMEGISAEAASLAGHLHLGNLIYVYDDNHITIDGSTKLSFSEDVQKRFEAQDWHVQRCDGLDIEGLRRALGEARAESERPSLVILRTTIGYGSPHKAGTAKAHGAPLGPEETRLTKQALGWPLEPEFFVPDDVRAYFAERIPLKRAERRSLDAELARWRTAYPNLATAWDAHREKRLPANLGASLAADIQGKDAATRQHSQAVIQKLAAAVPFVVGGSADLAESNLTRIENGGDIGPSAGEGVDPFVGRNLHFGIREHAMTAITNGINLDGTFLAFGSTFLIFSDYMRPSLRLAALMRLQSIFALTHDSIFLGEDGPTHQPIEHLDALRAIPHMTVFRPADGTETALAWAWAVERAQGPVLLALTRQKLPALKRPAEFQLADVWRGGYIVLDAGTKPRVVLLASGSEVSLACDAAGKLQADGVLVRVVSVPCLELLLAQPLEYRRALIPDDGTPVVAVEAALAESYLPLLGVHGLIYGIDRFGASAPLAALAAEYGFTPDRLASRVKEHLKEVAG
ncbi:MAG TPA: transketolase [Myxococcota bacterium]|nr:transketolase [Myxococcota bacterium]